MKTRKVLDQRQRIAFFDALAAQYRDTHGKTKRLLQYRLRIINKLINNKKGIFLEIGCGTGLHLFALVRNFELSIGTDFSPEMIAAAEHLKISHPDQDKIRLYVEQAEKLSAISDHSIDVLLCVGTLEHIPDKRAVFAQVNRILTSDGIFICLTPNGQYCWYTIFSRWLGIDTRHLSSDHFLNMQEMFIHAQHSRLMVDTCGYWRFIPKGDMPTWAYLLLCVADFIGRLMNINQLRGGLFIRCVRGHPSSAL